ncbi:MAG: methyltransferase domain-containing protein [Verrucomicrobiales bacterium]|nr:methyltransferase domain-containing protein [Verrucomicrobiales bacterium]
MPGIKEHPLYIRLRSLKWRLIGWWRHPPWKRAWRSETSKCRRSLERFCIGNGIDVGFGGDPIAPHALCMDLPQPYARYRRHVQHLHGSAEDLRWFRDDALDWLYSSHVLEDFPDTLKVLDEWIRVVRPGGHIILYLPDEQTYRAYCASKGKPPNAHHIHEHFGLPMLRELLRGRPGVEIIHERFPVGIYSFELVLRKRTPSKVT